MSASLKIWRILHAGYLFDDGQSKILFDPIFENPFSRNCYAFPEVEFDLEAIRKLKIDAIFISHYHDDHCSFESLELLDREVPIYLFCLFDEMFSMLRELGFRNIFSLKINQSVRVGDFEIICRRALDADVDSLFHVRVRGLEILNVVDSWIDDETFDQLRNFRWDLVLRPFQTMREVEVLSPSRIQWGAAEIPHEWITQLKALAPRLIVPSSCQFKFEEWSWFNDVFFPISYAQFEKEVPAPVQRMNPGTGIEISKTQITSIDRLPWVKPIGDQNLDYVSNLRKAIPSTADIAQKFPPLTQSEEQFVFSFCKTEIPRIFNSFPDSEGYFKSHLNWRLAVYDHEGNSRGFFYEMREGKMKVVADPRHLGWTTDIPLARLYGALKNGESLTSIYLRVNDFVFSSDIEKRLVSVDVLHDPLLRCLYHGDFGSYQAAQLRRLLQET